MTGPRFIGFCFVLFSCTAALGPMALAERVKAILADGTLELEDGRRVRFAGIQLSQEALHLLPTLFADREVDVKEQESGKGSEGAPLPGFLYVKMRVAKFPLHPDAEPKEKRIMVNEWLLAVGAAKVDEASSFEAKEHFLEIQAEASRRGEGIWSYQSTG